MFREKKIYATYIVGVVILFSLSFVQVTNASEMRDGVCQSFAREGNKLQIFVIGNNKNVLPSPDKPETFLEYFCAEVPQVSSTIRWIDLRDSSTVLKQHADRLQSGKYTEEQQSATTINCTGFTCDTSSVIGWSVTQDKGQPASIIYSLQKYVPGSSKFTRYYFYGEDAGLSTDYQVYYITEADSEHQLENPIKECEKKNNTDQETCENWNSGQCFWDGAGNKCKARADTGVKCTDLNASQCLLVYHCKPGENNTCVPKNTQINQSAAVDQYIADRYKKPEGYTGPLPDCAFTGSCRSIEDLIGLGVKVADWIFGIIAGLGLVFFVYGGFTMVLSFGNAEKVGHGKQILVAASIGMIIAFSAYILVSFIVKAIGINPGLTPFG